MSESDKPTVVVIGAGIIGLTAALKLQSSLPNSATQILLVSREWPTSIPGAPPQHSTDYASMWAGAHVRPIPASTPQLKREASWLKTTAIEFEKQVLKFPWIGITACQGIEYLESPPADYKEQTKDAFMAETGLKGYRRHGQDELPAEVELGYEYETYCINAPLYCANLLRWFVVRGGKTLHQDLKSEWEGYSLVPNVQLVINASGTGFGDIKYFPTRGQTAITNLTTATRTVTRQKRDGSWSFIIPRFFNGGTIMGGTKQPGDWRTKPDPVTRNWLLREGKKIAKFAVDDTETSTDDVEVIADVVGRRPTREGGMRIEVEHREVAKSDGQQRKGTVLHAYGAGGRGYEISWGVATEVTNLANSILRREDSSLASKL